MVVRRLYFKYTIIMSLSLFLIQNISNHFRYRPNHNEIREEAYKEADYVFSFPENSKDIEAKIEFALHIASICKHKRVAVITSDDWIIKIINACICLHTLQDIGDKEIEEFKLIPINGKNVTVKNFFKDGRITISECDSFGIVETVFDDTILKTNHITETLGNLLANKKPPTNERENTKD